MFTKIYEKVREIIKQNKYFIILFITALIICTIELPYYIEAPGGIIDISKRVNIESDYKATGSLNMAYVTEYKATIPTMIFAKLNSDWNIIKIDTTDENQVDEAMVLRNNVLLNEANYNATKVALNNSEIPYNITNQQLYVTYIMEEANTSLKVGDQIIKLNGKEVNSKEELQNALNQIDTKIYFTVIRDKIETECQAEWIKIDGQEFIGIAVSEVGEIESEPTISFNFNKRESGPSGGLMMSLAIYNALTENDITQGRKIVGTGTIDANGNVGEIDGVKYKLKGAIKEHADIFLAPTGRNYEEAIKIAKENNYKIQIWEVSTFEEAIKLLEQ